MVQAISIMQAVHKLCEEEFTPKGLSPPHSILVHEPTAGFYAEQLNDAGYAHVTGEQVAQAIIEAVGWDRESPWPGHPRPELVIEKLVEIIPQEE